MQTSAPKASAHLYRRLTGFSASGVPTHWRYTQIRRSDHLWLEGETAAVSSRRRLNIPCLLARWRRRSCVQRTCKHVNYLLLYFWEFLIVNLATRILSVELQQYFSSARFTSLRRLYIMYVYRTFWPEAFFLLIYCHFLPWEKCELKTCSHKVSR